MKNKKSKKRIVRRALTSLISAVMVGTMFFYAPKTAVKVGANNANVQKYEEQIAALQAKQEELLAQIATIEDEANSAAVEKQYQDALATTVNSKIMSANALIEELNAEIEKTEADIEAHEQSIAKTTEQIKRFMLMKQQMGGTGYLEVLFGSGDLGNYLARSERYDSLIEYYNKQIAAYREEKTALEAEKENLAASKELQDATVEQLEADKQISEARAAESERQREELEKDKKAKEAQYAEMKAASDALDRELTNYLQSLKAQSSTTVYANGDWVCPINRSEASYFQISCVFGEATYGGAHRGVDIACPLNTPIHSANSGTVVRSEWHYSYGNYVLIDHGNGIATLYAHMSCTAVGAGQSVSTGDVIGYVGNTGDSFGCHLHLEYRIDGYINNPQAYIPIG